MKPKTDLCAIPAPYAAELARLAPSVMFSVSREIDPSYRWDGDGPDPILNGFDPYDVTVKALTIDCGTIREGCAYLGGSYFRDDEPTDTIHGYLLQMLREAATELQEELDRHVCKPVLVAGQLAAVQAYLKEQARAEYEAQQADRAIDAETRRQEAAQERAASEANERGYGGTVD